MKMNTDRPYRSLEKIKMKITEIEKRTLELFKLLGNSTRMMIIKILQRRETNVTEIVEITGKDQSTVSKHLRLLKETDIVSFRTEGNKVFYRLKKNDIVELIEKAMNIMQRVKR